MRGRHIDDQDQSIYVLCRGKYVSLSVKIIDSFFKLPYTSAAQYVLFWNKAESVSLEQINSTLFLPESPVKPKGSFTIGNMTPLGRCLCYLLKSNVFAPTNKSRIPKSLVGMACLMISSSDPVPISRLIFYSILHAGVQNKDDKSTWLVFPSLITSLALQEGCLVFFSDSRHLPLTVDATTFKRSDAASTKSKHTPPTALASSSSSDTAILALHSKLDTMHELLTEMSKAIFANQASIIAIQNLLVSHGITGTFSSSKNDDPPASPLVSSDPNNSAEEACADSISDEDLISTLLKSRKSKSAAEFPCGSGNPSPTPVVSLAIPTVRRKLPVRRCRN